MIIPQPPAAGPDPGQPGHYAHHDWLEASVEALDNALSVVPVWTVPTLLNGWVAYGSGWRGPGFYKDAMGWVHLRGLVKSGAVNTIMFNLPDGYRINSSEMFSCVASGGAGTARVDVMGDGTGAVKCTSLGTTATTALLSLSGIKFATDPYGLVELEPLPGP